MAGSREYITVLRCIEELEIALGTDVNIAIFLFQKGFISEKVYDNVRDPTANLFIRDKANYLMSGIKDSIRLNPQKYHVLLSYFHQNGVQYDDIKQVLDSEFENVGHEMTQTGYVAGMYQLLRGHTPTSQYTLLIHAPLMYTCRDGAGDLQRHTRYVC